MTALVVQSGLWLAFLGLLLIRANHSTTERERAWREERAELLNRIQFPERPPVMLREPRKAPEMPEDDFDRVGTILFEAEDA